MLPTLRRSFVVLGTVTLSATLVAGCGGSGGDGSSADRRAATADHAHTTEKGGSVPLPAGWPDDVPLAHGRVVSATVDGKTLAAYVTVDGREAALAEVKRLEAAGYGTAAVADLGKEDFVANFTGRYRPVLNYQNSSQFGRMLGYVLTLP